MLGVGDSSQVVPPLWTAIEQRARLPEPAQAFLAKHGAMPVAPESRRGYHRMYLRSRAVLRYHEHFYAVFMTDVSRSGAGLFSPVQLLPSTPIEIWFSDGRMLQMKTKHCVRLEDACYRCGALFATN